MNPTQPRTPQPPPARPKHSLQQLDALCTKDMDNEALPGKIRIFAGRLHQVLLHVQLLRWQVGELARARREDTQKIDETFQHLDQVLAELTGAAEVAPNEPPPDGQAVAQEAAGEPVPEAGSEPAAAPPPPAVRAASRRTRPGGTP